MLDTHVQGDVNVAQFMLIKILSLNKVLDTSQPSKDDNGNTKSSGETMKLN